jgi:lipid-A-disaccharide synthase
MGALQLSKSCCPPCRPARAIEAAARASGLGEATLHRVDGQSHTVLAACDVTLIASGTATLEAALFKRPMVIAYNMNWLSWQIMRRKQLQPWVGLPNILCQDFVVPELLQEQATPQALAECHLRGWTPLPENASACNNALPPCTTNCGAIRPTGHRCDPEKILAR